MTFPSLFPLLYSTLPDSPPDSGSEAYSPQQVNGKCSKREKWGKENSYSKSQIQHPPPFYSMKVVGSAVFISREKTGGCTTWGDYQLVNIPQLSPIVPLPAVEKGRGTGTEGELGVHGHGIRGGNPDSRDTGGNPWAWGDRGRVGCGALHPPRPALCLGNTEQEHIPDMEPGSGKQP